MNIYLTFFSFGGLRQIYIFQYSERVWVFYLYLTFPSHHLLYILNDPKNQIYHLPSPVQTQKQEAKPSVWTMSCVLAGSVVILVFLNFSVNPVKRITCSVVSFFLAGTGLLEGLAALAGLPGAAWPQS